MVNNIKIVEVTWDRNISRICLKCDSIRTTMGVVFKTGVFLSSDVLLCKLYIYNMNMYVHICALYTYMCICMFYICPYICVCVCVCIYSNITINTQSTFLFCTKSRRQ